MRRGPAVRLPPAAWSGTGPWPARVGGTGGLRRNGDLFAKAYERVAGGVLGLFARASLPILSPAAPLPVVRALSRADSGRRAGTEGRGREFSCAGRHGEGQRLQGLRLLAASSGAGPDGPKRFTARRGAVAARQGDLAGGGTGADPTTTSTEGVTWICSRCSVPWTRTSIDLARTRAAFVAGHGPQVVAERRARAGCRPARDRRRAPGADASVSASGDGLAFPLVERPAQLRRHTARPGRYREPSLETGPGRSTSLFLNRPVAGRRCRTGALGAVAGQPTRTRAYVAPAAVLAFSGPAVYLYFLLPASPSCGSSVSRADSERRGRPEVMDGVDVGASDDRGCGSIPYRTGGSAL